MNRRWVVSLLAIFLSASVAGVGWAEPAEPSPQQRALAQALFEEGKRLLDQGLVEPACAKLAESYRLEPAGGTLLNLAACHEKSGRIATAWAEYQGAFELARLAGREDRMAAAQEKVDELGPRLPRVRILIEPQDPSPVVALDGTALGAGAFGSTIPVDPGTHEISAQAGGRRSFATTFIAAVDAAPFDVLIPVLEPEVAQPALAAPPVPRPPRAEPAEQPTESGRASWSLPWGVTFAATSASVLAMCVGFGVDAINKSDIADERCPDQRCDREGLDAVESGRRSATVANVTGAIAGALGATSIVFFALSVESPSSNAARPAAFGVRGGPNEAALEITATF